MRTSTKVLAAIVVGGALVAFMFSNFMLTTPNTAPSSSCVLSPSGQFTDNGKVCDVVNYVLFKKGITAYDMFGVPVSSNPYFYHLTSEGWKFLNSSNGGSYFGFTTHNLLTNGGVSLLQNMIHCGPSGLAAGTLTCATGNSFTLFTVDYLALSASSTAPSATDTSCAAEITEFSLMRTVGTYTAGVAASGSISPSLSKTWTASGTYNNIQLGCAWNTINNASPATQVGTLYAENTFSAVNLNSGDQLTITWTFTYSGP
ncbi:MAG: hypothetical protein LYZ69_07050 [Nitrososphaerales archaeon]|nr:hypothetical protein [Nitrososphaerales archaeon]